METEDKIFGLIAQAEDIQQHAVALQLASQDAVKTLPEAVKGAIRDTAREFIVQGAETASRGLLDASREAKAAASALRYTGLIHGGFLLFAVVVVVFAVYFASQMLFDSRVTELAELKAQIEQEQATLAELQSKTWKLELVDYGKEGRGIILPKGVKVDRSGAVQDGRISIVIKP
jgi:hypothetical protein